MNLKTDYKNDAFEGKRKYLLTDNKDGTWSIEDVTQYAVTGDIFSGEDINATNEAINAHEVKMADMKRDIDNQTQIQQVFLSAAGWNFGAAPYVQRVDVDGMKSTDAPIPGLIYPPDIDRDDKQRIDRSWDMITEIETFDGYLQVTCAFDRPIIYLTLGLKGR